MIAEMTAGAALPLHAIGLDPTRELHQADVMAMLEADLPAEDIHRPPTEEEIIPQIAKGRTTLLRLEEDPVPLHLADGTTHLHLQGEDTALHLLVVGTTNNLDPDRLKAVSSGKTSLAVRRKTAIKIGI